MPDSTNDSPSNIPIIDAAGTGNPDATTEGINLVDRFANMAAARIQRQRGPFMRIYEHEDIAQSAHLNLCQSLGENYPIMLTQAYLRPAFYESSEYIAMRQAINRAIGKHRDREAKRRQNKLAQEVPLPSDVETDKEHERCEYADLIMSLSQAMSALSLGEKKRKALDLRREGFTCEEIAEILHLRNKQAASELIAEAIKSIARFIRRSDV